MKTWDVLNENANQMKQHTKMFEPRISAGATELPGWEKPYV